MNEDRSRELKERRNELTGSLATLEQRRTDSYRVNSNALALDRHGVTDHQADRMLRLQEAESDADLAFREAQHELREIDSELDRDRGAGLSERIGRVMRRLRGSE